MHEVLGKQLPTSRGWRCAQGLVILGPLSIALLLLRQLHRLRAAVGIHRLRLAAVARRSLLLPISLLRLASSNR
jgi:hypothetical protein